MANELRSCPFCGGDAEMDTMQAYRNIHPGDLGTAVAVYCTKCSVQMSYCREDHRGEYIETLIELVRDDWNKRTAVPLAADDATVERIAPIMWNAAGHCFSWSFANMQDSGLSHAVMKTREDARAVLAELMKGPDDAKKT